MRSLAIKERISQEIKAKLQGAIDLNPTVKYSRTRQEQLEYEIELRKVEESVESEEEKDEEEEEVKEEVEVKKEYIFLIDRSGSMYYTITLAR